MPSFSGDSRDRGGGAFSADGSRSPRRHPSLFRGLNSPEDQERIFIHVEMPGWVLNQYFPESKGNNIKTVSKTFIEKGYVHMQNIHGLYDKCMT
jgi:hypothetical protein